MNETKVSIVSVSASKARSFLGNNYYPGQRPKSQEYVNFLVGEMERGNFQQNTQIVFTDSQTAGRLLIDGYSRMSAIVKSGCEQSFVMVVHKVDSDSDTELIYKRLDQGRKRSLSDTYAASGLIEKTGIADRTNLNKAGSAVRWIANDLNTKGKRLSLDVHQQLIEEWAPWYIQYRNMITGVHMPEHIRRRFTSSPMITMGLVTLREQPEKALEFWGGAALDDGLSAADPRKALLKFLDRFSPGRTRDSREYMPSLEYMKYLARIWNTWYDGGKLSYVKKSPFVPPPIEVKGTRYTVGERKV